MEVAVAKPGRSMVSRMLEGTSGQASKQCELNVGVRSGFALRVLAFGRVMLCYLNLSLVAHS